jgi:hypothetical protein
MRSGRMNMASKRELVAGTQGNLDELCCDNNVSAAYLSVNPVKLTIGGGRTKHIELDIGSFGRVIGKFTFVT